MKLAFIGAGNMGGAIAAGAVRSGVVAGGDVVISDPSREAFDRIDGEGAGMIYTKDNKTAVKDADVIIVSVKPWLIEEVLSELSDVVDRRSQVVASVAAGITFEQLASYLRCEQFGGMGIYRIVPNTAISLNRSVTFISSSNTTAEQDALLMSLFEPLGVVFEIGESQVQAVTALASSGIAYALRYIDAARNGGVTMGLEPEMALRVVRETVNGALALLDANGSQPQQEIDRVTTPGGMTLKGLEAMEKSGFSQAVENGLLATK